MVLNSSVSNADTFMSTPERMAWIANLETQFVSNVENLKAVLVNIVECPAFCYSNHIDEFRKNPMKTVLNDNSASHDTDLKVAINQTIAYMLEIFNINSEELVEAIIEHYLGNLKLQMAELFRIGDLQQPYKFLDDNINKCAILLNFMGIGIQTCHKSFDFTQIVGLISQSNFYDYQNSSYIYYCTMILIEQFLDSYLFYPKEFIGQMLEFLQSTFTFNPKNIA